MILDFGTKFAYNVYDLDGTIYLLEMLIDTSCTLPTNPLLQVELRMATNMNIVDKDNKIEDIDIDSELEDVKIQDIE